MTQRTVSELNCYAEAQELPCAAAAAVLLSAALSGWYHATRDRIAKAELGLAEGEHYDMLAAAVTARQCAENGWPCDEGAAFAAAVDALPHVKIAFDRADKAHCNRTGRSWRNRPAWAKRH